MGGVATTVTIQKTVECAASQVHSTYMYCGVLTCTVVSFTNICIRAGQKSCNNYAHLGESLETRLGIMQYTCGNNVSSLTHLQDQLWLQSIKFDW